MVSETPDFLRLPVVANAQNGDFGRFYNLNQTSYASSVTPRHAIYFVHKYNCLLLR